MSKKKFRGRKQREGISFNESLKAKERETDLVPQSINQKQYIASLLNCNTDIVIAYGPAGTGKTYLAMQAAIKCLRHGSCKRIVLTRPAVGVEDEKHGFLPGTLEEKMAPWTRPLLDVLREYYSPPEITRLFDNEIVEISPLAFMRGRTFKNAFIIGDEMQNATPGQMKMLMTRIGEGSKMVITGDIEQTDRRKADNGLLDVSERLATPVNGIELCRLTQEDIQRHSIIDSILTMYS